MGLSCGCAYVEDAEWYWQTDYLPDFKTLDTKRSRRCCSCKTLVKPGADVVPVYRFRGPKGDIEEAIYGENGEINLATWYLCEKCGGLYMAIEGLGLCPHIDESMADQIREYNALMNIQTIKTQGVGS